MKKTNCILGLATLLLVTGHATAAFAQNKVVVIPFSSNSKATGDAEASDVLAGKTFSNAVAYGIDGTMPVRGGVFITPGTVDQTIQEGYHNGSGGVAGDVDLSSGNIRSEINIFGVPGDGNVVNTASGDAIAGDMKSGSKAWVNGSEVTGTMATQILLPDSSNVASGFYEPTTLEVVDADLSTANIRKGVTIFGVPGSLNVVNTDSGDAIASDIKSDRKAYVDGAEITGTMSTQTLSPASTDVASGFYESTTLNAVDADLSTANIRKGVNIFDVAGDSNVVNTSSGDAVASDIVRDKKVWVDGLEINGIRELAPVYKSGQVRCTYYDGSNWQWDDDCTNAANPPGQDGELQPGMVTLDTRFSDNGDGTVTDNISGLVWLKNANCAESTKTWPEALSFATELYDGWTGGGSGGDCELTDGSSAGDWHLPNRKELQSLIHDDYYNPALSNAAGSAKWTEGDAFSGVVSFYYWSSATNANNPQYAWGVGLYYGNVGDGDKSSTYYVWPVRGRQ